MQTSTSLLRNFSVLAYANGFTLWHYKASQGDEVMEPRFWQPAADLIGDGDHVHVSGAENYHLFFRRQDGEIKGVGRLGTTAG